MGRISGTSYGSKWSESSYRGQWYMWLRRHHDLDGIARVNFTTALHNTHDARLADQTAIWRAAKYCGGKARTESVQLCAGIPQPRYNDHRLGADPEFGASWQPQEVNTDGRQILANASGQDLVTLGLEMLEKLKMDEVHLTQVWL